MVPGPVSTPGMRTMAFFSTAGEGDCCAATGAPPTSDVMTHTPVTTTSLLIQCIICAYLHPNGSLNAISWQACYRLRLKVTPGSSETLTWIKNVIEAQTQGEARTEQPGRDRLSIEAVPDEKPLLLLNGLQ